MIIFLFLFYAQNPNIFAINNSKFTEQFYAVNTGQNFGAPNEDINVFHSWEKRFSGAGIHIGVYATPCNSSTDALNGRIEENHYQKSKEKRNLEFENFDDSGTKIASLIAGNKGTDCNLGIAYESKLSCFPFVNSIKGSPTVGMIESALEYNPGIHIKSFPYTSECKNHKIPVNVLSDSEYQNISFNMFFRGRGGLGTIAVFTPSMCDGVGSDPNFGFATQTRFPINVAASTFRGRRAFYSPKSSNFIVNVPSTDSEIPVDDENIITNPIYSTHGDGKCGIGLTKLPAANAIATGAIALILQSNRMICARALQLALELSATINDANHSSWKTNAAGIKYSDIYGFGRLNVERAIEVSQSNMIKFMPREFFDVSVQELKNPPIPACMEDPLVVKHKIDRKINFIEAVTISIITQHQNVGDLRIELKSPSGTKVTVSDVAQTENSTSECNTFTFTARQFLGEQAFGEWELSITAVGCIPTGRVKKTIVTVYGMKKANFNPQKTEGPDRRDRNESRMSLNNIMNNSAQQPQFDPFRRDVHPSNNITYPDSKELTFSVSSNSDNRSCDTQYRLQFSCPEEYKESPAFVYIKSNAFKEPISPITFNHSSQINGYLFDQPFLGSEQIEFHFVVEVIASPTNVLLKNSETRVYTPCDLNVKQYKVIKRNEKVTTQFRLNSAKSDVYVTLADYDKGTILSKGIQKNTGRVSFTISDNSVERGILTIHGMNSDPCDLFINAFYVGEKKSEKPFTINTSNTCPKVSNLEYAEHSANQSEIESSTVTITQNNNSMSYSSSGPDDSRSGETNNTNTVVTIISIVAAFVIAAVVGSVIVIYKLKQKKLKEDQDYFSADMYDSNNVMEPSL